MHKAHHPGRCRPVAYACKQTKPTGLQIWNVQLVETCSSPLASGPWSAEQAPAPTCRARRGVDPRHCRCNGHLLAACQQCQHATSCHSHQHHKTSSSPPGQGFKGACCQQPMPLQVGWLHMAVYHLPPQLHVLLSRRLPAITPASCHTGASDHVPTSIAKTLQCSCTLQAGPS
jgi:hypothetical protein